MKLLLGSPCLCGVILLRNRLTLILSVFIGGYLRLKKLIHMRGYLMRRNITRMSHKLKAAVLIRLYCLTRQILRQNNVAITLGLI